MGPFLAATDLEKPADEAILQAHDRAKAARARLIVAHVIPNPLRADPLFPRPQQELELGLPALRARAADEVATRVGLLTGRLAEDFEVVIEDGSPHAGIVDLAEARQACLITVGGRGGQGGNHALLGSVADKVVRHAHGPVLVANPRRSTGRILVATDFSDPAMPAIAAAAEEARRSGARLSILHSIDVLIAGAERTGETLGGAIPGMSAEAYAEIKRVALEKLQEALARRGIEGDRLIAEGPAALSILRAAEELDPELIVLGTKGRTGLRRMLLGSVAEVVVRRATCPVLVVRQHAT